MTINITELILAVLGSGVLSALIVSLFARKKANADTAKVLTDAATALIAPLTKRIDALEASGKEKDAKIAALELSGCEKDGEIADLRREIEKLKLSGEAKDRKIISLENKLKTRDGRIVELEEKMRNMQDELDRQCNENARLKVSTATKSGGGSAI